MMYTLPASRAYLDFTASDEARSIKDYLARHGRRLLGIGYLEQEGEGWFYGFGAAGFEAREDPALLPRHRFGSAKNEARAITLGADEFAELVTKNDRPESPAEVIENIRAQFARMQADEELARAARDERWFYRNMLAFGFFALLFAAWAVQHWRFLW